MACFLLVTRFPELLLSVPFFFRRIADSTRLPAALPYFAMSAPRLERRRPAMLAVAADEETYLH